MQRIKFINLVQTGAILLEIRKAKIGKILVHVNNTLVFRVSCLAARHTTMCLDITIKSCR